MATGKSVNMKKWQQHRKASKKRKQQRNISMAMSEKKKLGKAWACKNKRSNIKTAAWRKGINQYHNVSGGNSGM